MKQRLFFAALSFFTGVAILVSVIISVLQKEHPQSSIGKGMQAHYRAALAQATPSSSTLLDN